MIFIKNRGLSEIPLVPAFENLSIIKQLLRKSKIRVLLNNLKRRSKFFPVKCKLPDKFFCSRHSDIFIDLPKRSRPPKKKWPLRKMTASSVHLPPKQMKATLTAKARGNSRASSRNFTGLTTRDNFRRNGVTNHAHRSGKFLAWKVARHRRCMYRVGRKICPWTRFQDLYSTHHEGETLPRNHRPNYPIVFLKIGKQTS